MAVTPWLLVGILVLLGLFAVLAVALKQKDRRPTDYYMFFVIGIIWVLIGIPTGDSFFILMGIAFAITGLAHKGEWKKNHVSWGMMSKEERRRILISALVAVLLAGILAFYLASLA